MTLPRTFDNYRIRNILVRMNNTNLLLCWYCR